MACLCGDLYCWSCGPAQGNHRCEACGEWTLDHEEPGSTHEARRCTAEVERMAREEAALEAAMEEDDA
jgi:hypothetical protein